MDEQARNRAIQEHLDAIRQLQAQATGMKSDSAGWPPKGYYLMWHIVVGMAMGSIGATVSLLANVIGAPLFDEDPLQLIRVYLTFPMGERALDASASDPAILTAGCVLYLITGAFHGVVFHLVMSVFFSNASVFARIMIATIMGLLLWVVSFYGVLSWLQPMLLGGNWIIEEIPPLVAALTHLAFAWTMLLVEVWGRFEPYRVKDATVQV